nr:MAG TPA: hypothetical protein [Bacteriophage sp.]
MILCSRQSETLEKLRHGDRVTGPGLSLQKRKMFHALKRSEKISEKTLKTDFPAWKVLPRGD